MRSAEDILRTIRAEVEERQAFRERGLTLSGLAERCDTNRTYVSEVLQEPFGGFFSYINNCRLAYAAKYHEQHPRASIAEIARVSGFRSRQSYYNALRRIEDGSER
jgi:AraC-like DNA-binding protein